MKLMKIPQNTKVYLDVVKLLAIVMVVFNHSGSNGYKMYLDVLEEPAHSLLVAFSAFIKIAVPLFFMASGALLLRREEPYGKVLAGRVAKFAAILAAVTFFYYAESVLPEGRIDVGDFLLHLYRNDLTGHLWYLYSFLCYLLLLPFLRKLAQTMRAKEYLLLMVVYQAAQLLPVVDYALFQGAAAHTPYLSFFMAADYVVYPLLGYYIDCMKDEEEREETIYILLFLSVLAILSTVLLMNWRYRIDGGWTSANREAYMGRLSLLPAVTVFYGMKKLCRRANASGRLAKALFVLGSCTFGVYLFDPKWRQFTQAVRMSLKPAVGLFAATLLQTLCACLLGLAATFVFKCALGGGSLLVGSIRKKARE